MSSKRPLNSSEKSKVIGVLDYFKGHSKEGNGTCIQPQELEVRSLYHLYTLKTKSSRCHYVVMTRSETKLSVAIPAPVSGQSAVNVATETSGVR